MSSRPDVEFRALGGKTVGREVVRLADAAHLNDAEAGTGRGGVGLIITENTAHEARL